MKFTITCLISLLAAGLSAQKPEQIMPNARTQKSVEYLREQSAAWQNEIKKDPKNANAWYNYYYANRNLGFNDQSRKPDEKQEVINKLLDDMGAAIPESYEYNIARWMNGGWDMKLVSYLEKAQKLGPDRPEHLDYSIVFAEMRGDTEARNNWSRKKHEAGQFSPGLLYYNHNVLVGLPRNAVLVTSGDNDTFPLWYLQSLGVRPDVTVVHNVLVNIKEYRQPLFARVGVKEWPEKNEKDRSKAFDLVDHLAANDRHNPVCLALTSAECAKEWATENYYLTGLAYLYSKTPVENMALLRRNFEQLYALDYIDRPYYSEISADMVKHANGNYLVPMLKLYEHYQSCGDLQRAEWMKTKLVQVSANTKMEKEVAQKLKEIN